jgi:hypothetical protein
METFARLWYHPPTDYLTAEWADTEMRNRTGIKLMAKQAPYATESYLSLAIDDQVFKCEDVGGPKRVFDIPDPVLARLDPSLQKQTRDIFDSGSASFAGEPVAWDVSVGSDIQTVWVNVKDSEGSVDTVDLQWAPETETSE